jgi:Fe-S-cluster containining protein
MPKWPNEPSVDLCITQCQSKCCRTSSLFLTLQPEEEHLFSGYRIRNEMLTNDNGLSRKLKGRFFWFMDTNGRCPHLDSNGYCTVYEQRPEACRSFPYEPVPGCLVWPPPWPKALTPLPSPTLEDELPVGRLNR